MKDKKVSIKIKNGDSKFKMIPSGDKEYPWELNGRHFKAPVLVEDLENAFDFLGISYPPKSQN